MDEIIQHAAPGPESINQLTDAHSLWAAIQSGRSPEEFGPISQSVAAEKNVDGRNALMWACHLGAVDWIYALRSVSQLQEKDCTGRTALMWAADSGAEIDFGCLVNWDWLFEVDQAGETAAMIAARRGHFRIAYELLIGHRYSHYPRIPAEVFAAAFFFDPFAIAETSIGGGFHVETIVACIESLPANATFDGAVGSKGQTALHLAARHGLLSVVNRMLDEGADPKAFNAGLRTPLMEAAMKHRGGPIGSERLAVADRLIPVSDPLWADYERKTALMHAAEANDLEMVKLLLPVSAANARTLGDRTACDFAIVAHNSIYNPCVVLLNPFTRSWRQWHANGHKNRRGKEFRNAAREGDRGKLLEMLAVEAKRKGAGVTRQSLGESVDVRGRDGLMAAAIRGHADCVEVLLKCCDPLATDVLHQTALMKAALGLHTECVKILLPVSHLDARDGYGNTALMIAATYGRTDIVELLLPWCRADIVNDKKETAAMIAAKHHHPELAELLASHARQIGSRKSMG